MKAETPAEKPKLTRRRWLIGCGGAAVAGLAAGIACDDRWDLHTSRIEVKLAGLGKDLDGFTIGHLTDLHRGTYIPASFLERAVKTANALKPDLFVLTGDYVTRSTRFMNSCALALKELSAPCGKVAVLGNHDYWTGADEVTRELTETAGVQVLKNRSILITQRHAALTVAGLDDPVTGHDDLEATLTTAPGSIPVVLLAHAPDIMKDAARRKVALVLAGHTHGGQIVIPGYGPPVVPSHCRGYASGLKHLDGTTMYVNRGVGMAILPVRLNCPPEIALITLRAA